MKNKIRLSTIIVLILACLSLYSSEEIARTSPYKVGDFEVYVLVEGERSGNTGILLNASEELLERYIPEEGFNHTTNAFLIKTSEQIILVDTGTGSQGTILNKIKEIGIESTEIDIVLLTHLHFDHFGGLATEGVANFPNAKIYVSTKEHEYFTHENANQLAIDVLNIYSERLVIFEPSELGSDYTELISGVIAIANYGHTPGHTIYLLENKDEKLIIAGDFLHLALVQFAHPEISATFDVDPETAAISRKAILEYAANKQIPIGGMHIVYPAIGNVSKDNGGFRLEK